MKTFVELNADLRFDTIEEAIIEAENQELEIAEIDVYAEDGTYLESETATRNPYSGDLVYTTWGVFAVTFNMEMFEEGKIADMEILAEQINSLEEAYEIAEKFKAETGKDICIQAYTQTISENLDNIGEPEFI